MKKRATCRATNNGGRASRSQRLDYVRLCPSYLGGNSLKHLEAQHQSQQLQIKIGMLQMIQNRVQLNGLPDEDPNSHLRKFLELCDTIKINGATTNAIHLHLFPFSLYNGARDWLDAQPQNSITTWMKLANRFLAK
ncbi:unnamed protein product [Linum trigynum]|uniref:Uncharacterized protein n=1 Tax=Linum trigynum TaxID=586398 RepID=A0AAV2F9Z4_9ROSI